MAGALHALRTDSPAQGPPLLADRLLQQNETFKQSIRARRTARHVDVHRQEAVNALDDAVDVVHAPGVRAGAHRDDPARLHHLVIEALDDRRHLEKYRTGNDNEVGLPRRRAQYLRAETSDVVLARECGGHLDVAAGQTEIERPDRVLLTPGDDVLQPRQNEMTFDRLIDRAVAGGYRAT